MSTALSDEAALSAETALSVERAVSAAAAEHSTSFVHLRVHSDFLGGWRSKSGAH